MLIKISIEIMISETTQIVHQKLLFSKFKSIGSSKFAVRAWVGGARTARNTKRKFRCRRFSAPPAEAPLPPSSSFKKETGLPKLKFSPLFFDFARPFFFIKRNGKIFSFGTQISSKFAGGGERIRTSGTLSGTTLFESAPFNHSGTPP